MASNRQDRDPEAFYKMMQQVYGRGEEDERHESPTRRLI